MYEINKIKKNKSKTPFPNIYEEMDNLLKEKFVGETLLGKKLGQLPEKIQKYC